MRGSYVLIVEIDRDKDIEIGRLGKLRFKRGYYLYVGSAINGLEGRIKRHLSKDKKMHWHIDYLLREGRITDVYIKIGDRREECDIAKHLSRSFSSIENFGSSDCKCKSHLFFSRSKEEMVEKMESIGMMHFWKDLNMK